MKNNDIKILLVDDEQDILDLLCINLEIENYQIETASNGKEAIEIAKKFQPHLIVLDVMMPELNGIEACKQLRQNILFQDTIIAFLSANSEEQTQIKGLESGADDYISKPIKPKIFVSKIKSLLRRIDENNIENTIKIFNFVIDRSAYKVTKEGNEIVLPKKEFELFYLLASTPGKVFEREEILSKVWGNEVIVGDRTIDVHIRKLREKLGENYFKTVKGVGYKLENNEI
ncbi:response regulator transcription factor [Capnocytophaga sp. ARDL2]|uniref:response regulator transcription factor n=1 Tax=Capnocytophaga sp. ARDL2 TaxID=3238809 RepID=UPI0035581327